MPLTSNPLPSIGPGHALPFDVNMLFAQNQVFTASGYLNNGGPTVQVDIGPGRFNGLWVLDLQTLKVTAGNETCQFALLGSNDPAFGNGNIELLAFHDFAAASSSRVIPTVLTASPPVPNPGSSVRRHVIPFSNSMGGYVLRYLQVYLATGGTAPSVMLSSWVTYDTTEK